MHGIMADDNTITLHNGPGAKAPAVARCYGGMFKKNVEIELLTETVDVGGEKIEQRRKEKKERPKAAMRHVSEREWAWSMPPSIYTPSKNLSQKEEDRMSIATTLVEPLSRPSSAALSEQFFWKKVSKPDAVLKLAPSFSRPHLKLVDTVTNEVHAVFFWELSGTGYYAQSCGQIQFRRSLGPEWETLVLLTLGTLVERERQRKGTRGNFTLGFMRT